MLRLFLITGMLLVVSSCFVDPFGNVRNGIVPKKPVLQGAAIPPAVFDTLSKSCLDCHSTNTRWPFYSYVAPFSWMVERDVSRAREKMNLSRWDEYSSEEKIGLLTRMGAAARAGLMPLPHYTLIHPDAKLSPAQIQDLYNWTRAERQRLRLEAGN